MQRAHKIRIYPNKEQTQKLLQTVGAARYCYNWALALWKEWYQDFKDGKTDIKPDAYKIDARWTKERPEWSKDIARKAQSRAIFNLGNAYRNFWNGNGSPKFKKRGTGESFYVANDRLVIKNGKIKIPKVGYVISAEELRFEGKIMCANVSTYAGKWFISISVETDVVQTANESICGVDVGMKTPAVCSDGTTLRFPKEKLLMLEKRLKQQQRIISRRKSKSKNKAKALIRKQRIQLKINNIRTDAIHKFTSNVTKNHGTIVIETLNIKGMHKSPIKNIRMGYQRSCMYEVHRQLRYKASNIIEAKWNYASSQLCSNCDNKQKLKLSDRVYNCPCCGLTIDRDLNAALNLTKYADGQSVKSVEKVDQ